jgi:hypothetical protein
MNVAHGFYQTTIMGDLTVFCCLLQFLFSVVYSFHCGGISLPSSGLILDILGAVANRIDFLNSHSIHCCCIERLLVFVN